MRKGSELIGKPVIVSTTGEQVATVCDLIIDQPTQQLLGLLAEGYTATKRARVLPLNSIQALNPDAVVVPSADVLVAARRLPDIQRILRRKAVLQGTRIETADGRELGTLVDLFVDEQSGRIEGYLVSGGAFSGLYRGPASADTAALPQGDGVETGAAEQVDAQQPLELDEVAVDAVATERGLELDFEDLFGGGRIAHWDIRTPDGTLIIAQDEPVTERVAEQAASHGLLDELLWAVGGRASEPAAASAELDLASAYGRQVTRAVRASRGLLIVGAGQIITQQVIDRARLYRKERELLRAASLLPQAEAALPPVAVPEVRDEATTLAQRARSQFWTSIRSLLREMRQGVLRRVEALRLKRVLGRRASRAIVDRAGRPIPAAGDLMTEDSVEQARQAVAFDEADEPADQCCSSAQQELHLKRS